jgi:putative membrane-bound dehydrogenase-like protein
MTGARRIRAAAVLCALALVAPAAAAQEAGAPDLTDRFELPDGLAVSLWAESPLLYNPTAMDVDARGRLWVAEAVNYRQWDGRNPGRTHPEGDRIVVLTDTDGDGAADTSTVFAQDEDLVAPLGIAVIGNRVIVSCSPNMFVYVDEDGDDVADRRETLLTGFGGFDHDHGLHSPVFGPDGRLYFNAGNAGPHVVEDRNGFMLRSGSVYNGGGPTWVDNRPGMRSDDGQEWTGGIVLSMEPDGSDLTVLAHNFRNPYEVAADAFGDLWQTDNDDDGNEGCRAVWILPGGNYGYFSEDGTRYWTADRRPGQSTPRAHWHQDDPGVVPTAAITGSGGPTGVTVYEGRLLGDSMRGAVLGADAGRGVVWAFDPELEDAGFALPFTPLIRAADDGDERASWFRPSDVAVGPDGTLYVSDWYDPGVGGHLARDAEAYGRILAIHPPGHVPGSPPADFASEAGLMAALVSPTPAVRSLAWSAITARGDWMRETLEQAVRSGDARDRARAVWLLARLGPRGVAAVRELIRDPDPRLRITVARALAAAGEAVHDVAALLVDDDSPAVRREAVSLLRPTSLAERRREEGVEEGELRRALLASYGGGDRTMLEALGLMVAGREQAAATALLGEGETDALTWSPPVTELVWRLHLPEHLPHWSARAMATSLSAEARAQALSAIAFTPGFEAASAMLDVALAGPEDTAELAAWWVRHRDSNDWAGYDLARHLGFGGWSEADERVDSGPVSSGGVPIDVDITGAVSLGLVVGESDNGKGHDWADWLEPQLIGPAGVLNLDETEWVSATTGWASVRRGKNCEGGPLAFQGDHYTRGIGTHAPSEIVFEVPEGYTRFRALAVVDDGGAGQPGAATKVDFRVYARVPMTGGRLDAEKQLVRDADADADEDEREEAAEALALDPEGGAWLIATAAEGDLDEDLREVVAESIFRNPDYGVRALAAEHFARPGAAGPPLPPPAEILARPSDARAGRAVFLGADAACRTCHRADGLGGDIGPDLTAIAAKFGPDALLDAMLNPSAAIAHGYQAWTFWLADGRVLSGFLLADGERVVIKDSLGTRHVVPAGDVVERRRQTLSLMPDNVALGLGAQDLADLVAFLLEDRHATPTFGATEPLLTPGSLEGWTFVSTEPGVPAEDVWSWDGDVLACKGTPIGYLRTTERYLDFELELEWRFPPGSQPGNSGVLLRIQEPDEVWPRSIEAQLLHRTAGDIYNIGSFDMLTEPSRTSSRRTMKRLPSNELPVGEWNRYRIRLDGPDLTLEVNGELQNDARWCAETPGYLALQSEGVPIEFRNVRLRPITSRP